MRKHFLTGAIAILTLGAVAIPASADAHGGGHVRRVRLQDRCDPASFDAVIGPGTCIPHRNGRTVTFDEFASKLNPADFGHREWNFHPDEIDLKIGDSISAVVRGGEGHSFTEVEAIGPGCIPLINDLLGLTGPAPSEFECFGPGGILETSGVAPNGLSTLTVSASDLGPGTHLFMCFIHPWMSSVVNVEADDDD